MIAILIFMPILFVLIFGFMTLGIYATWHDFDKPEGMSFLEHICKNKREIVKDYMICLALWQFGMAFPIFLLIINGLIK